MFYRPAFNWMMIAFGTRIVIGMAIHVYSVNIGFQGFVPLSNYGDDILYWHLTDQILSGIEPDYNHNFYPFMLAGIFTFLGQDILIGKFINLLVSCISVYLGVDTVRQLSKNAKLFGSDLRYAVNFTGILLTFYPSQLFYCTQLIKDPLIIFFGTLNIYLSILILKYKKQKLWFFWGITLLGVYLLRPYTAVMLAIALLGYLMFLWETKPSRKITVVTVAIILMAIIPYFLGKGIFAISLLQEWSDPEKLTEFRESGYSTGGSAADISLDFSNPITFLFTYGQSYLTAMFGPFPWQVRSIIQVIALPESLFMLFIALRLALLNMNKTLTIHSQEEKILLISSALIIAAIGLFSDSIGGNTRLRILPWNTFFIYSSIVFAKNRRKKNEDSYLSLKNIDESTII